MKSKLSPLFTVEEANFNLAWLEAMKNILSAAITETINGNHGPIEVLDSRQAISLTGYALEQVFAKETHPKCPYLSVESFYKEWGREFLKKYHTLPPTNRPVYLAFDRLVNYPVEEGMRLDQLAWMRDSILSQIDKGPVNDCQAIFWVPKTDLPSDVSPYIQRIWVRVYPKRYIDVQIDWRATDVYNHWQSRTICVANMIKAEIAEPTGCKIARILQSYNSLFIRKSDRESAKEALIYPLNPREIYQ